jgi:succinyl-CoA synthetase alpha subunit
MSALINQVRRGFYMDSVALMRISNAVGGLPGVERAAVMIGSVTNKKLLQDAGLLDQVGEGAGANDLILSVRANDADSAAAALEEAEELLEHPAASSRGSGESHPKTLDTALQQLPEANLALISVPGEFAAAEARRALNKGLHVMMFSDNVSIADEVALKQEAERRALLMMGPDCGTAIIGGVPLAFANVVPRGDVGIVAASGTGLQEVSTLIARHGRGVSHAIGVGGRDLHEAVGGIMTLMAMEALDRDPGTAQIVLISKPPASSVAKAVLERVASSKKDFSICFIGADDMELPANATLCGDLRSTAEDVLANRRIAWDANTVSAEELAARVEPGRKRIHGLFSGGSMCAEAQVIFRRAGVSVTSNIPIPGIGKSGGRDAGNNLLDLGDDEYTVGRAHPMIDPTLRNEMLREALRGGETAIVLLDTVLGYGAHPAPAAELVTHLPAVTERKAVIITSVCGTEADPQIYSKQVRLLTDAGIVVAPSNAHAAELAIEVLRRISRH